MYVYVCVYVYFVCGAKRKTEKEYKETRTQKAALLKRGSAFSLGHQSRTICLSVFNYLKYVQY